MSDVRSQTRQVAAWALLLGLLVFALRAPQLDLPLERDEGGYAYIAWRLLEGDTPYLDWFDQKPPGIFVAYAIALSFGSDPVVAIRGLAALCCAASAILLFAIALRLLGQTAGLLAGVLLAALSADASVQGPIANTELFMAPWILLAAWGTLRIPAQARPSIAAGLAIGLALGIASAFKQVAVVNAPFLLAIFWLRLSGPQRGRALLRFGLWVGLGGGLVWCAIAGWFWLRGGLGAALDAVLLHNLAYTAQLTLSQRLAQLSHFATPMIPTQGVAWLLAAAGLVALARRRDRFPALFLGGFAATNAIGVSASGLYFPHYFQQVLPAVAALAAAGVLAAADRAGIARRPTLAVGAALALAPLAFASVEFARLTGAEATRRLYPGSVFEAMPAIAAEIAALTRPEDSVFIFGAEPEILLHAERVSASRYIYLFPLYGSFPDAEQRQAGVIAELEAARPAVIVWIPNRMFFGPGSPQLLTEWSTGLIDSSYRLHALVAAERSDRGVLHRLEPGEDARKRLSRARPWARIFVRVDGDAPSQPDAS